MQCRLGGDAARGRPALGVRWRPRLEPGGLPRVRHRRSPRDADRRPRERLPGLPGACRARYSTTTCAPWWWSGTPTAAAVNRFQAGFLDFTRHCGFRPRLCQPGRAQTKGKVERFIRYLRGSFYIRWPAGSARRGWCSTGGGQPGGGSWLRTVANSGPCHDRRGAGRAPGSGTDAVAAVPPPYVGPPRCSRSRPRQAGSRSSGGRLQHPLALYDGLSGLMTG